MPKYQCPECEAVLSRKEAVPAGKKLRCPKCEAVFAAAPLPEEVPVAAANAPKPGGVGDEEVGTYGVVAEVKDDSAKPDIHYGSLRDKFAKSKRGPAMFKTVGPSNWLLRLGLITCVCAVAAFAYGIWPVVFADEVPNRVFVRSHTAILLGAIGSFVLGGGMCVGASFLHNLQSYALSWVGAILSLCVYLPLGIFFIATFTGYYKAIGIISAMAGVGVWCMVALTDKEVKDGFEELRAELEEKGGRID